MARLGIGGLSVAFGILLAAQVQGAEPVVQPGISGMDDRRPVESLAWPWRAIGRVNLRSGGYCTGTVIGADKVLTAAHCIWNQRTKAWLKPVEMYFVAGDRRGAFVAERRVASIEIAAGRALSRGKPNSAANDWAVLTLTKPVAALTGMVQVSTFTPRGLTLMLRRGAVLQRAGYSRDRSHVLQRHRDCNVIGFSSDNSMLHHDCDATSGDSGSPLLMEINGDYRIVGVHVGTATRNGAVLGVAVGGQRFRDWIVIGRPPPVRNEVSGAPTHIPTSASK